MLSSEMHILPLTNELMTIMYVSSERKAGNTCRGNVLTPSLVLWAITISPLFMSPQAFRVHYAQGSRCWKMFYMSDIIALTLPGKEEWENYAAFRGAICHHPFFFYSQLAYSAVSVCLFASLFFFSFFSPVLKGYESILCFSVWEKFQQQTFHSTPNPRPPPPIPSSWELRGGSAIFAAGEMRRGEARQVETQTRSMFGCWWRWGRCEKINRFVLYRLAAVQNLFNIYLSPPKIQTWGGAAFITACMP